MPTYRRRAPARRKPARKTNTTVRRVARAEAKKVFNQKVESKTFDGAIGSGTADWSGTVWSLWDDAAGVAITQGNGESQYVGQKVTPTYFTLRYQANIADTTNMVRIMILQDIVAGVPTGANVLQSVGNIRAPLSPLDVDYDQTYRVLADRVVQLTSVAKPSAVGKIKIGMRQLRPVYFSDAAGTYERGSCYVLVISDSGAATHPNVNLSWRWHFKDA